MHLHCVVLYNRGNGGENGGSAGVGQNMLLSGPSGPSSYRALSADIKALESCPEMQEQEANGWAVCGHFISLLQTVAKGAPGCGYPIFGLDMNSRALIRLMHRQIEKELIKRSKSAEKRSSVIPTYISPCNDHTEVAAAAAAAVEGYRYTDTDTVPSLYGQETQLFGFVFELDMRPTNRFVKPVASRVRVQQFLDSHAGEQRERPPSRMSE
jgi:hypothetical protein